jgi:hypothetical protein
VTAPVEGVQALDAYAILRALVDYEVDFVVIGGLAVAAHGYVRATKEVDVMPNPDPGNLSRLYRAWRRSTPVPLRSVTSAPMSCLFLSALPSSRVAETGHCAPTAAGWT